MDKTTVTMQYQCFHKYDIRAIQISSQKKYHVTFRKVVLSLPAASQQVISL